MRIRTQTSMTPRYCPLVGGSQAAIVGFVISDSSRALFRKGAWMSAVTQVPRFLAVAPGADFGSGNEVTVARHGRFVTEPPLPANNPLLHRPLR
jgi:hypothetical protein